LNLQRSKSINAEAESGRESQNQMIFHHREHWGHREKQHLKSVILILKTKKELKVFLSELNVAQRLSVKRVLQ
jgi:hypothetical protein